MIFTTIHGSTITLDDEGDLHVQTERGVSKYPLRGRMVTVELKALSTGEFFVRLVYGVGHTVNLGRYATADEAGSLATAILKVNYYKND